MGSSQLAKVKAWKLEKIQQEKAKITKKFNYETPVIIERLGEEDGTEMKPVIIRSIPPSETKILKISGIQHPNQSEENTKKASSQTKQPLIEKLDVKIQSTEREVLIHPHKNHTGESVTTRASDQNGNIPTMGEKSKNLASDQKSIVKDHKMDYDNRVMSIINIKRINTEQV